MQHQNFHISTLIACVFLCCAPAQAAITVNSSGYNGVTDGAVSIAGRADWGYINSVGDGGFFDSNLSGTGLSYNNTDFGSLTRDEGTTISTVSATSTIGTVTLTEGTSGTNTVDAQANDSNFSFGGIAAFGSYGGFAPTEDDVWQITFNDLGVGQFVITLYMGHSATDRTFDMDVSGTGIIPFTDNSPQIGTLGSTVAAYGTTGLSFTYDINVTTTDASDDLTLLFGGINGGTGGAIFAGYTVTQIPEPAAAMLGVLGSLLLLRRRRA